MRIQNPKGSEYGGKLMMNWEIVDIVDGKTVRALHVQVAKAADFTGPSFRAFLLPAATTSVVIDAGSGDWYFRVGAVVGDEVAGSVDWSGSYGPRRLGGEKAIVPIAPARLKVKRWGQTLEGIWVETGVREPYYTFVDLSTGPGFQSGLIKTLYFLDRGTGRFEIDGLQPDTKYWIRIRTAAGQWGLIGAAGRVESLCEAVELADVQRGRAATAIVGSQVRGSVDAVTRQTTGSDRTFAEANRVLLREARENPVQRFSSHSDYLRFVQAQTMNLVGR